jgi:sugar/nucleoside kinase (ribokinase family)
LNTAPVPELGVPHEFFSFVDFLCANETETEGLSGRKISKVEDAEEASKIISKKYNIANVIVTMGEKGSLWFTTDFDSEGWFLLYSSSIFSPFSFLFPASSLTYFVRVLLFQVPRFTPKQARWRR